jgi:hypothetical protein
MAAKKKVVKAKPKTKAKKVVKGKVHGDPIVATNWK